MVDYTNDSYSVQEPEALPCADKLSFDSFKQASTAANVADYQHGAQVKAYRCRYCDLWHLASA